MLFKTYLNRINVKYLNKNETAIKTVDQKEEKNADKAEQAEQEEQESGSTTKYLLKNLNKAKKMNINLFFQYWKKCRANEASGTKGTSGTKNIEENIINNKENIIQDNANEKNKNNWNNWGKINNYIYTKEIKKNVEYINIVKKEKEQEENQLNLFKDFYFPY